MMAATGAEWVIAALQLPAGCRVDKRVPKKVLAENGVATPAARRKANEGIAELTWVATLKPATIGIPAFQDDERDYVEIAVLRVVLKSEARIPPLTEMIHRSVPHPTLLIVEVEGRLEVSAVHKRKAQNEAGKRVLDGDIVAVSWGGEGGKPSPGDEFKTAMALAKQPRSSLFSLYQGWIDTLLAQQAAAISGNFRPSPSPEDAVRRRDALQDIAKMTAEIALLRAACAKERQLPRQVERNLEIKRLENQIARAKEKL